MSRRTRRHLQSPRGHFDLAAALGGAVTWVKLASVKFETPLEKEIPAEPGGTKPGMMRMADARQGVPRKENETRAQWKNRIFNFKRSEEAKHGVGGKGDRRGKRS